MSTKNIMIDLETMGNGSFAAIVSIGAVEFTEDGLGREFYENVELESSTKYGMQIEPATVLWWMQQDDDARNALRGYRATLPEALERLTGYLVQIGGANDICLWGNGATFDNVILRNAYKLVGMEAPWGFWNDRCYRTLKAMNKSVAVPGRGGVHHHALDDAKYQAECAIVYLEQGAVK